ncbi:MAG TPA: hypothetical protein GX512_04980 [Firmicutes bacterium]|nr:hypothetical protein [Candidatus Fermentithermobacillaceae bacterium]
MQHVSEAVVAAVAPPLKQGTIDRYLLLAAQAGIDRAVCINKIDQVACREGPGRTGPPGAIRGEFRPSSRRVDRRKALDEALEDGECF